MERTRKPGEHHFCISGLMLAGSIICGNEALGAIYSGIHLGTVFPIAAACFTSGILLDRLFGGDKTGELFRLCGIEDKDGKVPIVIKKTKIDRVTTLVIHMPQGISQHHFEKKRQELEQALNAKIEFGFNKNLIMTLVDNNLKSSYDYVFEGCEKPLEVYCGETHQGKFYLDIDKAPHMIVAGETNSGKSSLLRNMLLSLIINSHNIDIHLIDFQAVELGIFENCKKVRSYGEKPADFEKLMNEMEQENEKRLKLFRSVKNKVYIQNLRTWNEKFPDKALPHKVVFIDEYSRLAEKDYEDLLEKFRTRVAMDRKVGIHYIVAMQRPDVKCISGSIKANMPTRVAFKTFSEVDSEVILDQPGAEHIKQQGRFLIKYCGELKEAQALYIENEKVRSLIKKYGKYKSREEIEAEKREQMKALRDKCVNPYLKGAST